MPPLVFRLALSIGNPFRKCHSQTPHQRVACGSRLWGQGLDRPTFVGLLAAVYLACTLNWLYWLCPAFLCRGHLFPSSLASWDCHCIFDSTHKALHIVSLSLPAGIWSCYPSSGVLIFPLKFHDPVFPLLCTHSGRISHCSYTKCLVLFNGPKQPCFPWLQLCTIFLTNGLGSTSLLLWSQRSP